MKKFQRNFLMIFVLAVAFSFLVLSAAAAPGDVPPDERRVIETYYPQTGEPFPNPALLKEYRENEAPYIISVSEEFGLSSPPNWRMIGLLYRDPVLEEFLLNIDHTGISRDSVRPKSQEREPFSHVGRDASKIKDLPDTVREYVLADFLLRYPNGTEVVTDITAGELFETMETTFRCVSLSGSGNLDVFVRYAAIDDAGNFYRTCDLINMARYLQKIASQNGYDEFGVLPVQFMDMDEALSNISVVLGTAVFPKDPAERIRQYFPDDPELILKIPSVEMIERSNAYNELVKVDAGTEVPLLSPDWATVGMFFHDPAVSPLQSSLFCNEVPPPEYNYLILSRFPHYDRNGTFVIRDVSFGELLNATKTQFMGYGISSSGYLEVRVVCSSGYSKKDLLNVYNLIQKVAFMNGYDTAIPVIFLEASTYPPFQSAPPSSVTHVDENVWDRVLAWLQGWW